MNDGLIPMYDESGQQVMMTPEAALRAVSEGSAYPTDPTAIYSPEAAQQLAEFTAALQGEDVYTRRLQAMAQQYGAQTQQYSAVAQNAYNMGQLLMNASINNPYQYAQQAFQTDGSAPGFARALAQGFSYGDAQADPFDTSRLKGWDFGKTSQEQMNAAKSRGAPDYGGPPPAAQSGVPPASGGGAVDAYVAARHGPNTATTPGTYISGPYDPGAPPTSVRHGPNTASTPGTYISAPYDPAPLGAAQPASSAASSAYSNTAPAAPMTAYGPSSAVYGPQGKVNTGAYARASGLSGSGSSDIAWVNKSHDLIQQRGYGHGSDARNAAHQAAGMSGEEFDRIVKHGGDPFKRNQATGGMQVATRPETVHVGEHGKDELLIVLPLQRPGTAVPGFAAQVANSLHPQGNYVAHGGATPPGLSYAKDDPYGPNWGPGGLPPNYQGQTGQSGSAFDPDYIGPPYGQLPHYTVTTIPSLNDRPTPTRHLAQGGAVYGGGVNTLGVGNYRMSGSTPTPQGSVRVYANRGGMKTAPVTEGVMPASMGDPTALDKIAANQFLARQYDSLLKQRGYAGLDDYLARNQAARPQQRVQAGISYRGY